MYAIIVDIFGDKYYIYNRMYKRLGNYKIGFEYIDLRKNKKISDENILNWIKSLKIPPAYNDVIISRNKNNKILAYGYDSKGRKQCLYHPNFILERSKIKFEKILKSHKLFYDIYKNIKKDLYLNNNQKKKEIAIILFLIINCGFRIGNKKYEKDNNSYGISTIKFEHISFDNNKITIDFIGKKGVRNIGICSEKEILKYLQEKNKIHKNNENVFSNISSNDVNKYLKKWSNNITSKDLRTWNANFLFVKYVQEGIKECIKNPIKNALEKVANKLHNTVAVCKKNYIDPKIINLLEDKLKNDIYIKEGV